VRTGVLEEYVSDIIPRLFTDEELATCSITGKPCNVDKNRPVKPALDPERLNAARSKLK